MSGFVVDCSIAVSWYFEDEAAPETDALLTLLRDEGAIVPALWHLEIGNALLQAERRGRITTVRVATCVDLLARLPIETDGETTARALRETLALGRAEGLPAYDAAYLELAVRRFLPLATKDAALRSAAGRCGVAVLP